VPKNFVAEWREDEDAVAGKSMFLSGRTRMCAAIIAPRWKQIEKSRKNFCFSPNARSLQCRRHESKHFFETTRTSAADCDRPGVRRRHATARRPLRRNGNDQGQDSHPLEYEKVPLTVANFVGLAEGTHEYSRSPGEPPKTQGKPFYDGLVFHRVIPGFMIQGGDPAGNGSGGPGYRFPDEFDPTLKHAGPGILSMANSGPDSNGSQFFITHAPTPHLDNKHSIFGRVVSGQDVVDAIGNAPRGASDRPNEEIKIVSVKILRIGDKAKGFKGDQAQFDELVKSAQAKKNRRGTSARRRREKNN